MNGGPAEFWNGTSENLEDAGDQPTRGKHHGKNTPSGKGFDNWIVEAAACDQSMLIVCALEGLPSGKYSQHAFKTRHGAAGSTTVRRAFVASQQAPIVKLNIEVYHHVTLINLAQDLWPLFTERGLR